MRSRIWRLRVSSACRASVLEVDAAWCPLVGERLGELGDAAFAGCVGGDADAALEAEEAGDVDDLSCRLARDDVAGYELGELEDAGEVDLQDLLPAFERGVDGGVAVDGSGVVDEDVDAAEAGVDGVEEGLCAVGCGEIGLEGGGFGADGGCGLVGGATVAVHGDLCSGLGEGGSDGCAEAAGGAGDEGYFAVETKEIEDVVGHGHQFTCRWWR
jgi:hypothetical protein